MQACPRPNNLNKVRRLTVLALATPTLVGCAINPMVSWQAPQEDRHADAALDSMEGARAYAAAYKQALHGKAREYADAQVRLNDSLLGLGLLTLGTLASTAHKDVPLVLSGIFGGAYLYGQQNFGKPRLEVYQTGISATNCAVAAIAPLNFSRSELRGIRRTSEALATKDLPNLAMALSNARQLYADSGIMDVDRKKSIDAQLDGAATVYNAALSLLQDSSQLPGRVSAAAAGLKGTVDLIAAQVDKLASNTIVDPASVSRSLGGLAAIVGSVAPGAGLDTTFSGRITPPKAVEGGDSERKIGDLGAFETKSASAAFTQALATLAEAQGRVDAQVKYLGGRIAASKTFGNGASEALTACNVVTDGILALKVEPQSVTLKRPSGDLVSAEVSVTGGAKNYTGRFTQTAAGVEVVAPRAGEGTFTIKLSKDVNQKEDVDLQLKIEDSSNPPQVKLVPVKILKP